MKQKPLFIIKIIRLNNKRRTVAKIVEVRKIRKYRPDSLTRAIYTTFMVVDSSLSKFSDRTIRGKIRALLTGKPVSKPVKVQRISAFVEFKRS